MVWRNAPLDQIFSALLLIATLFSRIFLPHASPRYSIDCLSESHDWLIIAFLTCKSNLVPQACLRVYVAQIHVDLSCRFFEFCWNRTDDLGINCPALWPTKLVLHRLGFYSIRNILVALLAVAPERFKLRPQIFVRGLTWFRFDWKSANWISVSFMFSTSDRHKTWLVLSGTSRSDGITSQPWSKAIYPRTISSTG